MKINWELMKRKAQDEFNWKHRAGYNFTDNVLFLSLVASCGMKKPERPLSICQEWSNYGNSLIENWDIRHCMKLAELFPSCIPQRLAGKIPTCDYDERGNWVLYFE